MFHFHPAVVAWFHSRFGHATKPQERGWPAITAGADVLIAAPTGSGKTLAAFLACLDRLFKKALAGDLSNLPQIVYVSPLRALSNDIQKNLAEPLEGIQKAMFEMGFGYPEIRVGLRTGDTSQKDRQALVKRPPHILVTTPESLFLLLTSESGRKMLREVETLILDEIHAVADDRRGAHLMLSVERLAALSSKRIQRIGLSATQRPMKKVAQFLVGGQAKRIDGSPDCEIIDEGHLRELDLAVEIPDSPLEAVMSHEVWAEVHLSLVRHIQAHKTTLIFVNTRRLAERVTHQLSQQLGEDQIAAHHGSLSTQIRLDAETRLKAGKLKVIVATASLELGIDIGHVDLVCQIGSPRAIATFLQRIGRSGHYYGGVPKGRIYPLTRDELLECVALVRAVKQRELDALIIPDEPVDILAQQIVAATANEDWHERDLFELVRRAYPYRNLSKENFEAIVHMLNDGFTTKRGRRGAQLHYDGVNGMIRGRKGARLTALTCGGAIPDVADYNVILEPEGTFIGTLNEDFAVESTVGDIFQLGNNSWLITKVTAGTVRVADAHGAPPTIPFWLGEAPGRTIELSAAVGKLRTELAGWADGPNPMAELAANGSELCAAGWSQLLEYIAAGKKALGGIPTQDCIILERFFDEAGGMQLVIHAPFGMRMNRAWGLALRKRFCRSFNFELQAAATDDAIVLSLGPKHSFPLDEVFQFLNSKTVRDVLVQALLDAPMFGTRWRWNAYRSLALLRQRGGKRVPPQIQRMESEDFLAVVFPDQLACLENIVGDREVPDHPLAQQTVKDCLTEAMDIDGLEAMLRRLEAGELELIAVDVPEPSVFAHEVLTAKPYAFLDDAPLEERRTQAVLLRRSIDQAAIREDGILDADAIEKVRLQAWPNPENEDEVHEALVQLGGFDVEVCSSQANAHLWQEAVASLELAKRATKIHFQNHETGRARCLFIAAERIPLWLALFPDAGLAPQIEAPKRERQQSWDEQSACLELIRGRLEVCGPTSSRLLRDEMGIGVDLIETALFSLEGEGMVLRGRFETNLPELQWCNRRLLARIHQLTVQRLRQEIKPVSAHDALRFLFNWQRASGENRGRGLEGLEAIASLLEGFEAPAAAWESDLLKLRMAKYDASWLDQLCLTGRIRWGRLSVPSGPRCSGASPIKTTPITLFSRENELTWLGEPEETLSLGGYAAQAYEVLSQRGALFFAEIRELTGMLVTQVELALGELVALGLAGSDSFAGLRALLRPSNHKPSLVRSSRYRPAPFAPQSIEYAGRWSLLHGTRAPRLLPIEAPEMTRTNNEAPEKTSASRRKLQARQPFDLEAWKAREAKLEYQAQVLLRRYGILFRRLIEREEHAPKWRELLPILRRLEAIGEIRGGHFVEGMGGEHFALPEAITSLRAIRKKEEDLAYIVVGACDPLNLAGVLTPGPCIQRAPSNRILFQNGLPLAAIQAGELVRFPGTREPLGEKTLRALLELGNIQPLAKSL